MADEKRDESRDIFAWWGRDTDGDATMFARPFNAWDDSDSPNRYVPASDLEAAQRRVAVLESGLREICRNMPRNSRLVDRAEALLTEKPADAK
jgi:hypothetical protein